MKTPNGSKNAENGDKPLPNSKKVYVSGTLQKEIRVPFRQISLSPTKTMIGEIEVNEPVRVYDTSGPWGDPDFHGDVTQGLPPLRAQWIRERGDVEEINGREVQPIDDGFLSEKHAAIAAQRSTHHKCEQALNIQRSMEPARPRAEDRCAHPSVILLRNWRTPGVASSRPKWNSSRFARTWVAL